MHRHINKEFNYKNSLAICWHIIAKVLTDGFVSTASTTLSYNRTLAISQCSQYAYSFCNIIIQIIYYVIKTHQAEAMLKTIHVGKYNLVLKLKT